MFAASVFRPIVTARFGLCQNIWSETGVETSTEDTKRLSTTVSFPVVQFNAVKKQFVATCKVPIPATGKSQDRPFGATVRGTKAVLQITGSFSLAWSASVQRYAKIPVMRSSGLT